MTKLNRGKRATIRFLLDVIKPTPTLGKRTREDDTDDARSRMRPTGPAPSLTPASRTRPACIALQNEDAEEDAVVITALTEVPFCCHADLVTMNRAALLTVASTLNDKLPLALQIDTSAERSDAFIRNSIELLVGIRSAMPQAPKRTRSHSVYETPRVVPSSPPSPLAGRSRSNVSLGTSVLAMLREEDEGSRESERPQKRRRVAAPPSTPTSFDRRRPITRSQSHRVGPMVMNAAESPTAKSHILRTRSQKLPERAPIYPSIDANVRFTRGRSSTRGGSGYNAKKASFATTSTPKKRLLAAVNSPESAAPRYRPLLADVRNTKHTGSRRPLRSNAVEESTDMDEVTFDIDGLTMPIVDRDSSSSDMDISGE